MSMHTLKVWPEFFRAMRDGDKPWEFRKNDRKFEVGDVLFLQEWEPTTEKYTGEELAKLVTYVVHGGQLGIPDGYVIMSLV